MNAKSRFCHRGTSLVSGVVAGAMMLLPLGATAQAATFVVNSTGVGADSNPGDGICDDGAGNCTLLAAIQEANATSGTDLIHFNIPAASDAGCDAGTGVCTIRQNVRLDITDPVVIDGYTQSGASPNTNGPGLGSNAVLKIELDGTCPACPAGAGGLLIFGGNSTVRGLVINRAAAGVFMASNGGNVIEGNFIGTDVTGTVALGIGSGVVMVFGAPNNTIGGTTPGARNLISGNFAGVVISNLTAGGNMVQGNLIGTDVTGTVALGNRNGVLIGSSPNNTIGGTTPEARNIISGNERTGIRIDGEGSPGGSGFATGNLVQGNFIGTDVTGTAALGNGDPLISGRSVGVSIRCIGPDCFNTIGGTTPGAGNLISGNKDDGILLSSRGTLVQGNFIGTDVTGTAALGNGGVNPLTAGVSISGFPGNTIGGTTPGAGNLISGNNHDGVSIGVRFEGNLVQGNLIGTDVTGTTALGNGGFGVRIVDGSGNTIGGTASGAGNTIAFNAFDGVFVFVQGAEAIGNAILSNSIFSNGLLGIDLGAPFGVTPNDVGDGDTGANELQNFPVLTLAETTGASTIINGTLNSNASQAYDIELFSSVAADPSGFGEGQTFLDRVVVSTDAMGDGSFNVALPFGIAAGEFVTATATDAAGNTSEFSAALAIVTVTPQEPPTAVAGDDISIHVGETVFLDGSASFDDNTASANLLYAWSFLSIPVGSSATLSGAATTTPSFVADLPGTYIVQLIVTDEEGLTSAPDEVVAASTNIAPTADAADDVGGVVGFVTTLDGTGSADPDLDPLTFSWSLVQKPAGSLVTLIDADTDMPSFVPDVEGVYVARLVVNDGLVDSLPDEVVVTVISGEEFCENLIMEALEHVAGLPLASVTTQGNQQALTNFLAQAIAAIQADQFDGALNKLDQAISRTDGCVLRGGSDGNGPGRDWITDCNEQFVVYDILILALTACSP